MGAYSAIEIEILEKAVVVPSEETPAEDIWLSNLDLIARRLHTPVVHLYRPSLNDAGFFSPEALKSSLARALVPFYPLAGRLVTGADGRLCIRCTAKGALFVVARSESYMEDFGDFAPSEELRRLLVPSTGDADEGDVPLVMFQLTFFGCGGVCLGTAIHHTAADGPGSLNFINTWAKITRTKTHVPIFPPLDRTVLRARSPPSVNSAQIDSYPQSTPSPPSSTNHSPTSAILKLSKRHLQLLKNPPTNNNLKTPLSTFKAVAPHIWRSTCKARELDPSSLTRIHITADTRSRLRPPLPNGYLGNAAFRTSAEMKVGKVLSDFGETVAKIEDAVKAIDDEFVRSLLDYLEGKVNQPGMRTDEWVTLQTDLLVISWMSMPVYEADFGWGKPIYMGRASTHFAGVAFLLPSSPEDEEGGVTVVMTMEEGKMEKFKEIFFNEIGSVGSVNIEPV